MRCSYPACQAAASRRWVLLLTFADGSRYPVHFCCREHAEAIRAGVRTLVEARHGSHEGQRTPHQGPSA